MTCVPHYVKRTSHKVKCAKQNEKPSYDTRGILMSCLIKRSLVMLFVVGSMVWSMASDQQMDAAIEGNNQ